MRTLMLLAFFVLVATEASAYFCKGCGCKGGSGWRVVGTGKCVGCGDVPKRCGEDKAKCTFDGLAHLSLICVSCQEHAPKMACPIK